MPQGELPLIPHEVQDRLIYQRAVDGYINATAMCQAAGKAFADYARLVNTKAFAQALQADMGIPITELIQVVRGGATQTNRELGCIHRWLSIWPNGFRRNSRCKSANGFSSG